MKKNNMKKGIFTALLLASPFVTAGTQYPAADFQPKVVFQDKDYQHEESQSSSSSTSASFGEKSKVDSNYPAATYQPEVLYHDTEYKHKSGTGGSSKSAPLAKWTEKKGAVAETAESVAVAEADESSVNPLFAIVILGVAGFLFLNKSKGGSSKSSSGSTAVYTSGGLTGVARYLENKSPKLSGVAKYLELNQPAPKSGVAKYVARKVVAAKKAASEKTTGVEKYVRKKG